MKIIFLLEEKSMKETLNNILPKILPAGFTFLCVPHEGKQDLKKSVIRKLKAWNEPDVKFVIVHDKDANDCKKLKQELMELTQQTAHSDTLIRIVCTELESWFLGDLQAVDKAFATKHADKQNGKLYRNPDNIANAKQELQKLVPSYQQISGSKRISESMDIVNNRSHSFNVFITGIKKLCRSF
jgi:hypothetical protein